MRGFFLLVLWERGKLLVGKGFFVKSFFFFFQNFFLLFLGGRGILKKKRILPQGPQGGLKCFLGALKRILFG